MAKKAKKQSAGTPDWMVTFSDMMSLLLCFFVILVSMSEIKSDQKFYEVMQSLRVAFGGYEALVGAIPGENQRKNTLIERLEALELPSPQKKEGDVDDPGIDGLKWRVTDVRQGTQIVVGGLITFDRFSAELKPQAQELVAKTAEALRGQNLKIAVTGHTTREDLPPDAAFPSKLELSFARAQAVRDELIAGGVRADRIMCVAAGDSEPLVAQAYTEERRAQNRRVDIVVTEDTVEDYEGSHQDD
ncbi:MAG: hypothetical protein C4547_09835 [Phycisphaerales bacterium]|nr:MAG: hypothetical protein C4547_09835 [Phycisphaerales bacterium]